MCLSAVAVIGVVFTAIIRMSLSMLGRFGIGHSKELADLFVGPKE